MTLSTKQADVSTSNEKAAMDTATSMPVAYAFVPCPGDSNNESRAPLEASAPPAPFTPPTDAGNRSNKKKANALDVMLCGDVRIRGRRIHPGTNTFLSLCGDTTIDIRESELPPGAHIRFIIVKLCGDAKIIVPKGTNISVTRISLCGDKDINLDETNESGYAPSSISATIIAPLGSVKVMN